MHKLKKKNLEYKLKMYCVDFMKNHITSKMPIFHSPVINLQMPWSFKVGLLKMGIITHSL